MEVKRKFPHFWSAPPEKVGYTYAPYFLFWMGLIIFMLTLGFPPDNVFFSGPFYILSVFWPREEHQKRQKQY